MPGLLAPCRDPLAGSLELLACCPPFDARHPLPIWRPEALESQKGKAPLHARVQAAAPQEAGLLWCHLEVALRSPLWEHALEAFCVVLIAAGAHPVIGVAAQHGVAAAVGLDHFGKPHVQGLMHIGICEDRGHRLPLRGTGLGVHDVALCSQDAGLQPLPAQPQQCPVIDPHPQPVCEPGMVQMVKRAHMFIPLSTTHVLSQRTP